MRIDFLGLQAFLAIAERGSFQMAAAYLNLSQTALSHRIRKIEEELGVQLFLRTTRTVALTPVGSELLPKVRSLIGELASAMNDTRRLSAQDGQKITIGCLPTVAAVALGPALCEFHELYPGVAVKVHDQSATDIADLLSKGLLDFAVTISTPLRIDFHIQPLRKDPMVLVCRCGDEPSDSKTVAWSDLGWVPLIRIGPHIGNRMDEVLGGRSDRLNWRYEVQHAEIAISFVRAGLGMTVVPQISLRGYDLEGLNVLELRDPLVSRQLGIVTRREHVLSPVADELRKLIGRQFQKLGPSHC